MSTTTKRFVVGLAVLALLVGACGDDDDTASEVTDPVTDQDGDDDSDDEATGEEPVVVTVTADGIEAPAEIAAGAVEVTLDNQTGSDELDLGFARIRPGTSEEDFRAAILAAFEGEAIDDVIEAASGLVATGAGETTEHVLLEPGEHFVFAQVFPGEDTGGEADDAGAEGEGEGEAPAEDDGEGEGEGGPPEGELLIAAVTVTEGDAGDLPEGSGTIVASDYAFDVDVSAGESFVFRNEGPEQFHHAVLFDFGEIEPSVVEENIKVFLESEGQGDLPEEFSELGEDPFVGGSSVFSAGLGGTFQATLEEGKTYAAVCFIGDRAGGPPHAFAHDMFEVFTVQ